MTEEAMSMGREVSESYWIQSSCLAQLSTTISTGLERLLLAGFSKRDPRKDLTEPTKISMVLESFFGGVREGFVNCLAFECSSSVDLLN